MANLTLKTPIGKISGIGPVFQKKLKRMGIKSVEDLLFHFPSRYEDFSKVKKIKDIKPNEKVCLAGRILDIKTTRTWKKKMFLTEGLVEDKSGAIQSTWFNQPYLKNVLKKNDYVLLAGRTALGKNGLYLSNPAFEKIPSPNAYPSLEPIHTGRIVPVYPETEGLSSRWLRHIIYSLLKETADKISEPLPLEILKKQRLMPISRAIWQVHFPRSLYLAQKAKERFSFEGLFLIEISVLMEKMRLREKTAPAIPLNIGLMKKFVESLPFKLTNAQRKCAWQILKDIEKPRPMSRLLQGDVSSGKTAVALMAALEAAKAGWQTAFMAPTEILAKQHFQEAAKFLQPFKVKIALLTGKEDKIISQKIGYQTKQGWKPEVMEISRRKLLEKAAKAEIDILIGTHSLIQDKVKFGRLALVIVDEQHRFGVEQRARLAAQPKSGRPSQIPHFLSMTATPIPRTLALTVYGNLDLSVLDEMPKGRKKIITEIVLPKERPQKYRFIKEEIKRGKQVFVICPRIEKPKTTSPKPSSWTEVKAVEEEYEKLSKEIFPELNIGMLHGRMKPKEKEKIMADFKNKKFDILVSTSVIEVGIDVPNATIILIEGAERFGLAQLHQFRGRVGRSKFQSYCFLFTDSRSKKTWARLKAISNVKDGFELAEKDLQIRGPGSVFGAKQWGLPDLAMDNLKNFNLVKKTRESAKGILEEDPALKKYHFLKEKIQTFRRKIHLE